jgi:hypothetical protein
MARRTVIHVTYKKQADEWHLKGGSGRVFETKEKAVAQAKREAKTAPLGQVVIHKQNGVIQTEHTYGEDPERTKG